MGGTPCVNINWYQVTSVDILFVIKNFLCTQEIPDLDEEEGTGPVMVHTTRSYSPGKVEAAALLDYEVTEPTLPDTVSGTQN